MSNEKPSCHKTEPTAAPTSCHTTEAKDEHAGCHTHEAKDEHAGCHTPAPADAHACCGPADPTLPKATLLSPEEAAGRNDLYFCPMCPEIFSEIPAACPKCGMALEPMMPSAEDRKSTR